MAFFSKLKKLWSTQESVDAAVQEYEAQRPAAPGAEATPPAEAPTASVEAPAEKAAASEPADPQKAPAPESSADWGADLTTALRQAEPRLSIWLDILLQDITETGPDLWDRLLFLFKSLQAPEEEARDFIARFESWLDDMGYKSVEEFRSELQYRLALALDLEDEEDERSRLFLKLSEGLSKTKEKLSLQIDSLLDRHGELDDAFWEELEEILIMADVGFDAATKLLEGLKSRSRREGVRDSEGFREILRKELEEVFKAPKRITSYNAPEVVLVVGVNGVGKTTTIAKLAHRAQMQGRKVLVAAGDTFRAAAIEQLEIWSKRVGAGFYAKKHGADPAAVAYEAVDKALQEGFDLVFLDTAGRLHTKANLMEELTKIKRVCGKKHDGAPHKCVLVVDATTGQNAISQTKLFHEAVGVDEIILTKLDGTAKGGVVVSLALLFHIPITYVGLGEQMEDLRPFSGGDFAKALLG
jgi:fused signal recognition particle receptor